MVDSILDTLKALALYLDDANKRLFWWYLLSACVLALPVYLKFRRHKPQVSFIAYLFDKRIWLSRSAKQDYMLWVLNRFIRVFIYAPIILLMVPVAMGFSGLLESGFGARSFIDWPQWAIISVFTLALFLADDFSRFFLHYVLHKVPFLWHFHKVHHSAEVLTPFTVYRSHPIESYLYACRMALSQGMVVGGAYYLFGPNLKMYDVVGANIFVFAFNIMGSNLRHSHVWLSWGGWLEKWFISPAQHQIHHSDRREHFDKNLGSALAIWDRLFGTLLTADKVNDKLRFGLGKGKNPHQTLWQIYLKPFKDAFSQRPF